MAPADRAGSMPEGGNMRMLICIAAGAFTLLGACSTTLVEPVPTAVRPEPTAPELRNHVLYIGKHGDLLDPEDESPIHGGTPGPVGQAVTDRCPPMDGKRDLECEYVAALIGAYVEADQDRCRAQGGAPRAVAPEEQAEKPAASGPAPARGECKGALQPTIHIHGGLNSFEDVRARARVVPRYMLADGHYPFMIGWPTGPYDTYEDHLLHSDRGRERGGLARSFYGAATFVEDIARSVARWIPSLGRQLENAYSVGIVARSEEEDSAQSRSKAIANRSQEWLGFVNPGRYQGVGQSLWTMIPTAPALLVSTPVVDGLGSGAWDAMLRRSDHVLTRTSVYQGTHVPPDEKTRGEALQHKPGDTAASRFLVEWQRDAYTREIPINLIGHSMGAIVALNVLGRHPAIDFRNVVFMGAAARIKDVENVLVPWLARHPEARFFNLSLDPYNEIAESNWFGLLPRGSLLMWIDDTFGEVNTVRDRTIGKWWNVLRVAEDVFPVKFPLRRPGLGAKGVDLFESVPLRERVSLKRFPIQPDGSDGPQKHTDFNNYCFWREDFWKQAGPDLPLVREGLAARQLADAESCARRVRHGT
jgi:pimeloyl-ACP methyl ester carboxylesterase